MPWVREVLGKSVTLQRRHILWLLILTTAGVVVDCHNLHVAVSTDEEHDAALGLHSRELAALEDRVAAQKILLDRQQLLIGDHTDLLDDQADQIVDLDNRLRALEVSDRKVCKAR